MSIVISSGHSTKVRGAAGPSPWGLDEVNEATRVVNKVGELLRGMGVGVTTFHDTTSTSQSQNLDKIVDFHNSKTRDLDVSVHFNAYSVTTTKKMGVEVLYVTQQSLAAEVSAAIAATMALPNRGAKKRTDLAFLNGTEEPAILIETCFCDAKMDCDAYRANFDAVCAAIATSISGQSIGEPVPPVEDTDLPEPLDQATIDDICVIACDSDIAEYNWKDRGKAPLAYTQGMALAFAMACRRFEANDPAAIEMAKADTGDDDLDALSWYRSNFQSLGMSNAKPGIDTLRHLYVLLLGLGMRESSGKHCEGKDQSASNTDSETCEAGLFQTSWNIHTAHAQIDQLFDQYMPTLTDDLPQCHLDVFEDGVTCSQSSWTCYGDGDGRDYQELAKACPVFAAEVTALGLRNRRKHWGPLERREVELKVSADELFKSVQDLVLGEPVPPVETEQAEVAIKIEVTGKVRVTINGQVYE